MDLQEPRAGQKHPLDEYLGPFFTTQTLAPWLGVTVEAVLKRVTESTLIALQMGNGDFLYPTFQFTERRTVIPHLMEAVGSLRVAIPDTWSCAMWVNTKLESLGNSSVAELLSTGEPNDFKVAMWFVETEAARLSQ